MFKPFLVSLKKSFLASPTNPYFLILIGAAAFTALQYNLGVLFSWDSNWYLILSQSWAESSNFDRKAVFPPLYYFSLAVLQFLGLAPEGSVVAYWFVCYSVLVACLYRLTKSIWVSSLVFLVIFCVESAGYQYRHAWTELGYATLLVALTVFLYEFLTNRRSENSEVAFLVCLALLPLQRYIGAYVALYMGVVYLAYSPSIYLFWSRIRNLLFSTTPLLFVIIWNLLISGEISGSRSEAPLGYIENFKMTMSVIFDHFRWVWLLWLLCLVGAFAIFFRNRSEEYNRLLIVFLVGLVPLVQMAAQIHASSTYQMDAINSRFFIVLVPFFFLYFLLFANLFFGKIKIIVSATVIFGVALLSYGDSEQYDFLEKDKAERYTVQIREFLGQEPPSTIGFYRAGKNHLAAQYILGKTVLPYNMCGNYVVRGSFRHDERLVYVPKCDGIPGHQFVMVRDVDEFSKQSINMVSIISLPKDWKSRLGVKETDQIVDAGIFKIVKR